MPNTSELYSFARRLRSLRRAFGTAIDLPELTSAEFAQMLAIPATTYAAYEEGRHEPSLATLAMLHNRTGVSLDWLVAHEDREDARREPVLVAPALRAAS